MLYLGEERFHTRNKVAYDVFTSKFWIKKEKKKKKCWA